MPDLSSYKLTFQDEFTSLSLYANPNGGGTWKTWFYFGDRSLPSNGELQYYMDPWFKGSSGSALGVNPFSTHADPTQAGDNVLRITAQPSSQQVKNSIWGYNYTSGLITTEPTFTQKYGYFEIRAKLPEGKGMWPAFWLLPADKTWPPEIDVLEAFGGENSRGEGGPFEMHWGAHSTAKGGGGWVPTGVDIIKTFNTYAVDWQADYITYYFNGQQVGRIPTPADMHKPMYMLANIAVGGNWPEAPAPGAVGAMDIDYIRAYSKDPNAPVYSGNTGPTNPVPNPTPETPPPSTGPVLDDVVVPTLSGAVTNILANGATTGTNANDQLNANWGNTNTFRGGKGDDLYGVGSTSMKISENAGEGVDTVSAWVEYTLPAYVENIVVGANYGVKITGNDGANVLKGNVGNDTMTGRDGKDLFVMAKGGKQDVITDFKPGTDLVKLEGYSFADFNAVKAAMTASGGNVVLNLGNGDSLTFQGRAIADFTAADFGMTSGGTGGTGGTGGSTTPPPATGGTTSTITVRASGDSWNGAPQFQLFVDGKAVGTAKSVTAAHASGAWQDVSFTGDFGATGPGKVEVRFINDGYGGSSATDRNLYVDYIDVNGKRFQAESAVNTAAKGYEALDPNAAEMLINGSLTFTTSGAAPTTGTGSSGGGTTTPPATMEPVPADMAKLSAGTQTGYYVTNAATKTATGTAGNDHIWSNGSGQTLVGNGGDDLFHIGTNTDAKIVQSTGLATVETWAGSYTLASGAHNIVALGDYAHTLTGNTLNNAIVGSNGVDTINGAAGNDMLIGGNGKDVLSGGAGKDLFVYRAMAEAGDRVKDFVKGEDLLDLRTLMKAMNVASDPVAAGIVKFADAGTGTMISIDADGAGAGAAVALVTIENTKISASDYVWH